MIWIIYIIGCLVNFILLWEYLMQMIGKPIDRYAIGMYLFSVFCSWMVWIAIFVEWVWRKIR